MKYLSIILFQAKYGDVGWRESALRQSLHTVYLNVANFLIRLEPRNERDQRAAEIDIFKRFHRFCIGKANSF